MVEEITKSRFLLFPMSRKSPESGGSPARTKTLILKEPAKSTKRFAAVAGGKAAECFVVACCCPCTLVNILFLAVVKIPAGLFRRAMRRRKRRRMVKRRKRERKPAASSPEEEEHPPMSWPEKSPSVEVSEMEEKMWPEFFGTGFWRSPSQRELVIRNNC